MPDYQFLHAADVLTVRHESQMSYSAFLRSVIDNHQLTNMAQIYHHVRNIPYGSNGNRDPRVVHETNVGSCSGKHILLRDLLRSAGFETEIITIFTYFNQSTPICDSFPDALKTLSAQTPVPDFHHYVRVKDGDGWHNLDATWHDALTPFGFTVNSGWTGSGDTKLASVPEREYPNEENIIAFKAQLVGNLRADHKDIRSRYFAMVTQWIAEYATPQAEGPKTPS